MRKSNVMTAILSTASLMCVAGSQVAEAKQRDPASEVTLDYYLPEVRIGFAVSHTITACPNKQGEGFAMETFTAIKPTTHRGEQILIDPKGGFLIDRKVDLQYHKDGTLKSFNGSSTGQGGKFVAAAIKAATFVVTTAMGVPVLLPIAPGNKTMALGGDKAKPPTVSSFQCKKEVAGLLKQKADLEAELTTLKQGLIRDGTSQNVLMQIAAAEAAIKNTEAKLTVKPDPAIWNPKLAGGTLPLAPKPADLSVWFDGFTADGLQAELDKVGLGQVLAFQATVVSQTGLGEAAASTDRKRDLVYRVPASVEVAMGPVKPFHQGKLSGKEAALARAAYDATKVTMTVAVPQIGALKRIAFDGSSIFASRAVSATFEENGALSSVGYASTGGADAFAGVVDASVAAAIELRDQETNATKREVERRTQANALEALIEAEAKAQKAKEGAPVAPPAPAPGAAG